MVPPSKLVKFQMSFTTILQPLLKKQKNILITHKNISLISYKKTDIKTPFLLVLPMNQYNITAYLQKIKVT